jgi:hypothetical protein
MNKVEVCAWSGALLLLCVAAIALALADHYQQQVAPNSLSIRATICGGMFVVLLCAAIIWFDCVEQNGPTWLRRMDRNALLSKQDIARFRSRELLNAHLPVAVADIVTDYNEEVDLSVYQRSFLHPWDDTSKLTLSQVTSDQHVWAVDKELNAVACFSSQTGEVLKTRDYSPLVSAVIVAAADGTVTVVAGATVITDRDEEKNAISQRFGFDQAYSRTVVACQGSFFIVTADDEVVEQWTYGCEPVARISVCRMVGTKRRKQKLRVIDLSVDPRAHRMAVCYSDHVVFLFDTTTGRRLWRYDRDKICRMAYHHQSNSVFCATEQDDLIRVFCTEEREEALTSCALPQACSSLLFSENTSELFVACGNRVLVFAPSFSCSSKSTQNILL